LKISSHSQKQKTSQSNLDQKLAIRLPGLLALQSRVIANTQSEHNRLLYQRHLRTLLVPLIETGQLLGPHSLKDELAIPEEPLTHLNDSLNISQAHKAALVVLSPHEALTQRQQIAYALDIFLTDRHSLGDRALL